jgi:signal transduction histidine kinase
VDVGAVVTQALAFLAPEFTAREIGVVRAGELDAALWVLGDKDLLYRAFYNIMTNAVQAMGGSGTLTITLTRGEGRDSVVSLLFHDSGPGFPGNDTAQYLDPFFTTKDDGTGLGLPIVQSIITSHGGELSLSNAAEGGAVVGVTLPAAPESIPLPSPPA